jgi:hypothetical protein
MSGDESLGCKEQRMSERSQFDRGMAAGALTMVGGLGLHWFISPHPDAGILRHWLAGAEVLMSFAVAGWLRHHRAFLALRNDIACEASEAGMTEETIDALLSDD